MDIHKILIAVDGSKNAERAIEYVADITRGAGGFVIKLLSIEHLPDRDFLPMTRPGKRPVSRPGKSCLDFWQRAAIF